MKQAIIIPKEEYRQMQNGVEGFYRIKNKEHRREK